MLGAGVRASDGDLRRRWFSLEVGDEVAPCMSSAQSVAESANGGRFQPVSYIRHPWVVQRAA